MADFWIKIEKTTPDKPEILELAGILGIEDPDTVTGKMIRVWSWFDSNSENGHAPSVTKVLLDRLTGVTGFTDSLVTVGWLEETESGFTIPNFDRHLGKNSKRRASDAERKRKSREKSQECHTKNVTKSGLDKIREDKDNNTKKELINSAFNMFWSAYHKKQGKAQAEKAFNAAIKREGIKDPSEFAGKLIADCETRIKSQQFGFDKLSASTYLNNNRWEDEQEAKSESQEPSARPEWMRGIL